MSGVKGNIGTSSWRFLAAYFKDLDIANGITSNSITSKSWITSNIGMELRD